MSTTAEGVETEQQLEMVRAHGASEVQGFLFSPPLPPAALAKLLHSEAVKHQVDRRNYREFHQPKLMKPKRLDRIRANILDLLGFANE